MFKISYINQTDEICILMSGGGKLIVLVSGLKMDRARMMISWPGRISTVCAPFFLYGFFSRKLILVKLLNHNSVYSSSKLIINFFLLAAALLKAIKPKPPSL